MSQTDDESADDDTTHTSYRSDGDPNDTASGGFNDLRLDWRDPRTIRYSGLLTALILSFLLSGIDSPGTNAVVWSLNVIVVVLAFRLTRYTQSLTSFVLLGALAAFAIVTTTITEAVDDWRAAAYLAQFLLLSYICLSVIRSILRRGQVDGQTLLGTITAYILIGMTFSWLYLAIDVWDNDQLNLDPSSPAEYPEFSFITMTTVGFGNQLPTANLAARIVVIEVLIAQLFLATFVARMVSMYRRRTD